jgi:hypothetical protein
MWDIGPPRQTACGTFEKGHSVAAVFKCIHVIEKGH